MPIPPDFGIRAVVPSVADLGTPSPAEHRLLGKYAVVAVAYRGLTPLP